MSRKFLTCAKPTGIVVTILLAATICSAGAKEIQQARLQDNGQSAPEPQQADGRRHGLPPETYAVAPGTKFLVVLEQDLTTRGTEENTKFVVRTVEPLEAGRGIYLPPGADIHGHVSRVEPAGVKKNGVTSKVLREHLSSLSGDSSVWPRDEAFSAAFLTRTGYYSLSQSRVLHILRRLNESFYSSRSEQVSTGLLAAQVLSALPGAIAGVPLGIVFGILFTGIYSVTSHWIWSPHGWLFHRGMQDFAGSTAVHLIGASGAASSITSGRAFPAVAPATNVPWQAGAPRSPTPATTPSYPNDVLGELTD